MSNEKHVIIVVEDPINPDFFLVLGFLTSAKQDNYELSTINYDGEKKTQFLYCAKRLTRIPKIFFEKKNKITEYIEKDNDLIFNKIIKKLQENLSKTANFEIVDNTLITRTDFINYIKKNIDNFIIDITKMLVKMETAIKDNEEHVNEKSVRKERDYYRNLLLEESPKINYLQRIIIKFYLRMNDIKDTYENTSHTTNTSNEKQNKAHDFEN